MLILLDSDGLVVGTLPYDEPPDTVMFEDGRQFDYEDETEDGFVYREVVL